jgi:glycosyltransferase involved in cell wall biosynthesis
MSNNIKEKLVICTTVPDTILYILKGQPKYLNQYFEVVIITCKSDKNKIIADYEGVRVYEVAFKRNINLFFDLTALFQMIFLLIQLKPRIIHSYTPKAGLITMLASWVNMVPIRIHTFTGLIFPNQNGIKKRILILIDRLTCLCSTKIIPEGKGVMKDLISYKITDKHLEIIGNGNISGVDTKYFSNTSVEYDTSQKILGINNEFLINKFVYCFIGRLNKDKGISELYNAFVTLPENTCLLIAGELDMEGNSISLDLYDKLKNHNRIFCLGFVKDVRYVLKLSNILVLPSYREGFPNVLLQALSMGVPVIATNVNGCNEIVLNNFNGWLVEPKNHLQLTKKMLFVITISTSYFEIIRNNSRQSIIDRYEQVFYRNELFQTYKDLVTTL